jgi:hypothetical protein
MKTEAVCSSETLVITFKTNNKNEDGGSMFLRNIGNHLQHYMVSQSKDSDLNSQHHENLKSHKYIHTPH